MSSSASATSSIVRRPPGEPRRRWTIAAPAIPVRKAANVPIATDAPSTMQASDPKNRIHRPIRRSGSVRCGDAVAINAVATASLDAKYCRRGVGGERIGQDGRDVLAHRDRDQRDEQARHEQREEHVAQDPLAAVREQHREHEDDRPDQQEVIQHLPHTARGSRQLLQEGGDRGVGCGGLRRRHHERRHEDDRDDEEDGVGWTSRSRRVAGRREDPDVDDTSRALGPRLGLGWLGGSPAVVTRASRPLPLVGTAHDAKGIPRHPPERSACPIGSLR